MPAYGGVGYDPLKNVMPPTPVPVQNIGGMGGKQTAPLSQRPVANPALRLGAPGPQPGFVAEKAPAFPGGDMGPYKGPPADATGQSVATTPRDPSVPPPVPPAPAPAPPAPVPPAPGVPTPPPAPVPQAPGGSSSASSSGTYGSSGGISPGTQTSLEDSIRQYITNASGGVTSKAFIDRAKGQLGSAVEGQRAVGARRINDDAVRRGLFKSGIPAEGIAAGEVGANNALSSGIADILSNAEKQDIAGRESAAGVAGNLLSSNRSWDQWQQERADAAAARAGGGGDTGFDYIDPETGEVTRLDEQWF